MKKNFLKKTIRISGLFMLAALTFFTSCKPDDEDEPNPTLVEDGIYVKGAGTALTDFNAKGLMTVARNEVLQEDRSTLLEIYVAVKAGTDGFNIVKVAGATHTVYGPGSDFAEVTGADLDGDEPTLGLMKGTYTESATTFQVTTDGLYHITIDTELGKIAVAKVVWGVIGAATPGGWTASTQFTEGTFDLNTIVFEINDLELTKADWKFRYSNGWKVIIDADYDLGGGDVGIKVNTNFGGAVDALVAGGDNIANDVPGKYTVKMTWTLGSAQTATMEKTGDLAMTDYSATELGLVGNALVDGDGWTTTYYTSIPEQANTVYTWTWSEVELLADSAFKIREGQTWDNISIGYPQVTMAGSSAANFEDVDGNFGVVASGTFDFTFVIDASTETYTLTVEPGGTPVPDNYWGIIGSSVPPYDWSVDVDMTWESTTNVWSITTDLVAGEWKFRADDDWTLAYGIDGDGNLTSEGGATNMTLAEDGNYTIELILTDSANPTYTVTKN